MYFVITNRIMVAKKYQQKYNNFQKRDFWDEYIAFIVNMSIINTEIVIYKHRKSNSDTRLIKFIDYCTCIRK